MSAEFELLRFEAIPATGAVAVVELDGRFPAGAPARVRLLVERGDRRIETPALATQGAERPSADPGRTAHGRSAVWTASFAVELDALHDEATQFALAPGRGPLIGLPSPTLSGDAADDRFVRLARQANELRHRLTEAVEASAARERIGDELAAERDALKATLAETERRAEEAAERAASARDQRDSANAAADHAREELAQAREKLRESDARAHDAERDRAALRARAESAERTLADVGEQLAAAEEEARAAAQRAVAVEDELRLTRRDLRDTRARVEALLREQRHPVPERRGHEVTATNGTTGATRVIGAAATPAADDDTEPETGADRDPASGDDAQPEVADDTPPDVADDAPPEAAEDVPPAGTDTDEHPEVGHDERTAVLEPTSTRVATAARSRRFIRIADHEDGDDEVLDPAAVGARYIEPAETTPGLLTPARIVVGAVLLLLVVALVAILLGAGVV